jgi:hypothetical protein
MELELKPDSSPETIAARGRLDARYTLYDWSPSTIEPPSVRPLEFSLTPVSGKWRVYVAVGYGSCNVTSAAEPV